MLPLLSIPMAILAGLGAVVYFISTKIEIFFAAQPSAADVEELRAILAPIQAALSALIGTQLANRYFELLVVIALLMITVRVRRRGHGEALIGCPTCRDSLEDIASSGRHFVASTACGHTSCHACYEERWAAGLPCPVCRGPVADTPPLTIRF